MRARGSCPPGLRARGAPLPAGRAHFPHARPTGARSWAEPSVARLLSDARVGSAVGRQCQHGQRARGAEGNWRPVRKSTRWASTSGPVLYRLGRRCRGGRVLTPL
eukprot:12213139-Alexandrium_andersonii.AAC.1